MITARQAPQTNPYIEQLRQVRSDSESSISWAVFADDDPVMLRLLSGALKNEAAAIVPLPQPSWSDPDDGLGQAVVWSINELAITSLALVGSSAVAASSSQSGLASHGLDGDRADWLLASIRAAEARQRQVAERFAQRAQSLLNLPEVGSRIARGELRVHCLFYRAESGVFTVYNPREDSFEAILN